MSTPKSFTTLVGEIDQAVNPNGGEPKNTSPALNGLLKSLALEITAPPAAGAGAAPVLYAATGAATDGAMTQQATTAALADKLSLSAGGSQTVASELILANGTVDAIKFYDGDFEGTALTRVGWRASDPAAAVDVGLMRQQAGVLKVVGTGISDYAQLEAAELTAHSAPAALNSLGKLAAAAQASATVRKGTGESQYYDLASQALASASAGDVVEVLAPLAAAEINVNSQILDVPSGVSVSLRTGVTRPNQVTDILTLRGGKGVINGGHHEFTEATPGNYTNWLIGHYPNVAVDYAIEDLNITLNNTVAINVFNQGTIHYSGRLTAFGGDNSVSPSALPATLLADTTWRAGASPLPPSARLYGRGSAEQTGGTLMLVHGPGAYLECVGDITCRTTADVRLDGGTLCLRQGLLRGLDRPAGAEKLILKTGAGTQVILENYTVLGTPGVPVIEADTVVLRGSTVVVGTIVAGTLLDERPAAAGAGGQALDFVFEAGFADEVTRTMGPRQAGTYAAEQHQNVASASYYLNGSATPAPLPLTLAAADVLRVQLTRQDTSQAAVVGLAS